MTRNAPAVGQSRHSRKRVTYFMEPQPSREDHPVLSETWDGIVTISELIDELVSLKAKHGDVPCVVRDSEYGRRG
jgi:hypothetical protein